VFAEDCALIDAAGWHDDICASSKHFICEQ
jgi:hypothetical protein